MSPDEERYVERSATGVLTDLVTSVWVQCIPAGGAPYPQRDIPHGGADLVCPVGGLPRVVGPRTTPRVTVLTPGTTVVGLRLRPGVAAALLGTPPVELVDAVVPLDALWGRAALELGERIAAAPSPEGARDVLELAAGQRAADRVPDPLVAEAVRRLMPGGAPGVQPLPRELAVSERQLRRRCLAAVGLAPKALHSTLRFQGFLARAQQAIAAGRSPGDGGLATLAVNAGYTDQAHLTRECVRFTGTTPRAFLTQTQDRCGCGHDHAASFVPMLRPRRAS